MGVVEIDAGICIKIAWGFAKFCKGDCTHVVNYLDGL